MSIDSGFNDRLELLVDLMALFPDRSIRRLQKETLAIYPLYYTESRRHWLSHRIVLLAMDRYTDRMENERGSL